MEKYKLMPLEDYPNYIISSDGKLFKLIKDGKMKELSSHLEDYGFKRVNIRDSNGKVGTRLLHTLVYTAFKGKVEQGQIVFLDKDKTNCNIENLISIDELVYYYNKGVNNNGF